jgi:hypothetical protein
LVHATEHRTHVCTILGANGIEPPDISVGAYEEDELSPNATKALSVRNPDFSGGVREED